MYYPLVLRTSNGGLNWYNVGNFNIDSLHCISIYAINENVAFVISGYTDSLNVPMTCLYKTSNAGQNWTSVLSQSNGYFDHLSFKDTLNGFLLGDPVNSRWSFWRTSDGGNTWDSTGLYLASEGVLGSFNRDLEINGDTIWFGTGNNRIYSSYNFGNSWKYTNVTCPTILTLTISGSIGFAAETCIFKTSNSGLNWQTFDLPHYFVIDYFTHVNDKFWYTTLDSIYYSSDNGNTFILDHVAPIFDFYWQISLKKINNQILGWAVGQNGTISKYTEPIGIKPISSEIPNKFELFQNYPNPFNPSTIIKYSIAKDNNVSLKVYNVLGQLVTTLVNEFQKSGEYKVTFNGENFASGVYFYKLESGSFVSTKKMVLMK